MRLKDREIQGYAVAKNYGDMAELGPLVCRKGHDETAIDLLKACLSRLRGLDVFLCAPERERVILSLLNESGFSEEFRVTRMFFKPFVPEGCIYVAESLERG
jgi:hypothetical protein